MSDFNFYGKTISVDMPSGDEYLENFGDAGEIRVETEFEKEIKDKLNILILDPQNENFDEMRVGEISLFGKNLVEYVINSCPVVPSVLPCQYITDVLETVKPYLNNKEYTLVLYSDTPLITKHTLLEILDFVYYKGINVCKFNRGYCFKTEYIKRISEIFSATEYTFCEEDFTIVNDTASLAFVKEIMKNRIVAFHIKNGVYVKSPDETYIESDVIIEKGTEIDANTRLVGKSEIGSNCKIGYGTVIENAKLEDDVDIVNSSIRYSVICEKTSVMESRINACKIGKNCTISSLDYLQNCNLEDNIMVNPNTHLYFANIGENTKIAEDVLVSKSEGYRTLIGKNVEIASGVRVLGGISISDNKKILPFETILKNM